MRVTDLSSWGALTSPPPIRRKRVTDTRIVKPIQFTGHHSEPPTFRLTVNMIRSHGCDKTIADGNDSVLPSNRKRLAQALLNYSCQSPTLV